MNLALNSYSANTSENWPYTVTKLVFFTDASIQCCRGSK